jgi:hypothetical protein
LSDKGVAGARLDATGGERGFTNLGGPCPERREHQKPWGSSGCGGEWGELDIVSGHGRIPGGEQVAQRAIEGAGLQEPMSTFL